jgi:hypothetical protein
MTARIFVFIPRNVFDDATTKVMGDAFDTACKALPNNQPGVMHEIMARRIVRAAGKGERDVNKLCATALGAVAASFV